MNTWKGLAHIALFTADMERSIAFYENLGGVCTMRSQAQKPEWVNQLALVDIHGFTLEIVQPGGGQPTQSQNNVFGHIAIAVDSLEEAIEELRAHGVDTFMGGINELPNTFGGVRNVFFTGPDGEQIELLQKSR